VTHDDGTDNVGFSRLTDGDSDSYWKSNPYLTQAFTGEDDSLHPQWVILDLASKLDVTAIRIAWAEPYATKYLVQYWTGDDPIRKPTAGVWQTFPAEAVTDGKGGNATLQLAMQPLPVQFIRILMTSSSNTCDTHGAADKRNCVGYAIRELYLGTTTPDGKFHDLIRHTPDQDQTATYCSSVDPWHEPSDLNEHAGDQVGFDLFFTSGATRGLPTMIPIAMLYGTPEDAAGEIAYIEKRGYPISYVEMGEEADGHYTPPEGWRQDTFNDNRVVSIHSDYQEQPNGGNGWLRIMTFSPANNSGFLHYAAAFGKRRKIEAGNLNRLYVVESILSPTGAKADHRLPVKATQVESFARAIAGKLGVGGGAAMEGAPA